MFEQITDIIGLEIGELLFLVANIALIVIAVFLFIRLRKLRKKSVSEKDKEHELSGIGELKPEEFKPERLGLKPEDIAPAKKTEKGMADKSAKTDELKLEEELPVKELVRMSVVSVRFIKAGTVITDDMLTEKRPGTGISAEKLRLIVGATARCDIQPDQPLTEELVGIGHTSG